jgi:hypothetical protein
MPSNNSFPLLTACNELLSARDQAEGSRVEGVKGQIPAVITANARHARLSSVFRSIHKILA